MQPAQGLASVRYFIGHLHLEKTFVSAYGLIDSYKKVVDQSRLIFMCF